MVDTNGIKLHVVMEGPTEGPAVILLHGFPEFHYGWHKQVPALARAGFRVIVPDQRGYFRSDKPKGIASYDVDILAEDIAGLMDSLGIQNAFLAGHDWGAVVAWTLAINHPERLKKLAILNVPHPDVMARFLREDAEQRKKSWYIFFFQIPFLAEWMLGRNDFRNLRRMLAGSGKESTFSAEDLAQVQKAWAEPGALSGMLHWYRAIFRRSLRLVLFKKTAERRVTVPTLMLWGKQDVALSHAMVAPSIALCDTGEAVVFENATHWVQHDAAEEVNQRLVEFFR